MTILEQLGKRGAYVKISPGAVDRLALVKELFALRTAGHAIVAEETFDHKRNSLGITVTHYLTCGKCPS